MHKLPSFIKPSLQVQMLGDEQRPSGQPPGQTGVHWFLPFFIYPLLQEQLLGAEHCSFGGQPTPPLHIGTHTSAEFFLYPAQHCSICPCTLK